MLKGTGFRNKAPLETFIGSFYLRNKKFMDDIAGFHEKELDGLTQELLDEKASLIEEYHVGFSVSGKPRRINN